MGNGIKTISVQNSRLGDFPGGPVVKTPASIAGGIGSIPGLGTKIPHAVRPKRKRKKNPTRFQGWYNFTTSQRL